MNRDKQIEELQNTLIKIAKQPIMIEGLEQWSDVIAEELYAAGYRKASEVAREIFEEIDKLRCIFTYPTLRADGTIMNKTDFNVHLSNEDYDLLKKKYTGEDINVTTKESEDTE